VSLLAIPVSARDHVRGPAGAPVTLVAYSSYLCLHCRRIQPLLDEIFAEHAGRLRMVHRHFARNADLPFAEEVAEAAEAAGAQGRFWEMHDALLAGPHPRDARDLEADAARLGLDLARFRAELAARLHRERVMDDLRGALAAGVRGTPTLFVGGVMHRDSWDLDGLRDALAAAVRQSAWGPVVLA
jgi:protein-disulfide isomerase